MRLANHGAYGRGIYFAGDASYSASGYSHHNTSGNQVLILAKVLVGNYTEGPAGSHITCPPLLPGSKSERYDSIKAGASDIFIVYNNNKAYPSYTIEYNNQISMNNGIGLGAGGIVGVPIGARGVGALPFGALGTSNSTIPLNSWRGGLGANAMPNLFGNYYGTNANSINGLSSYNNDDDDNDDEYNDDDDEK
jgi:hypothetical protein